MIFHSYVNVYQRVSDWKKRHITSPKFVVDPQPIQLNWIYINPSLTTRCSMEVINMEAWFLKPQFRNWWNLDIDKNYEGLLIRSFSRDLDATWKAGKMNIRRKHQGVYVSTYANRLLIFFAKSRASTYAVENVLQLPRSCWMLAGASIWTLQHATVCNLKVRQRYSSGASNFYILVVKGIEMWCPSLEFLGRIIH